MEVGMVAENESVDIENNFSGNIKFKNKEEGLLGGSVC